MLSGAQEQPLAHHQAPSRVIIHLDLDCFYCQVEQKRLSIPRDVPCAVQQWNGLIAVNYAARAAGITRHMRVAEAKRMCPELQLVHVQTIGGEHAPAAAGAGQPDSKAAAAAAGDGVPEQEHAAPPAADAHPADGEVEGSAADRGSSKASLQRYRKASAEIMRLLAQSAPGCPFEKASIDEAYLDITGLAAQELTQAEAGDGGVAELISRAAEGSTVLGDGGLTADVDYDRLAAAGAVIAQRLRGAVAQQLSFTCSAGIGPNKLLAKIGSAKNKPNKQTVVLPRAIDSLMQDLPVGKIKGLGGKLGAKLEGLGAATAGAAAALSWEVLVGAFDSKALWVWETVRGIDAEAVTPKSLVKSINSCKSFEPTSDVSDVTRWLAVLAAELAERMAEDEADNSRRAKTLVLQYRTSYVRGAPDRSIRGPLPRCGRDGYTTQALTAAGQALFKRITPAPFPLVRLAVAATEFADLPGHGSGGSSAALQRFLATGVQQQQQQQQQQDPPDKQAQQQQLNQQQLHRKQTHSRKQPDGQTRLDQFAKPSAEATAACSSGHTTGVEQQQQHAQQHPQDASVQPPQQQLDPHHNSLGQQQPLQQGGAEHMPKDPPPLQQQQQQQHNPNHQQQQDPGGQQQQEEDVQAGRPQQESVEELAALAGVDLAQQARILRDIEIEAMIQSRHTHQQQQQQGSRGPGGSSSSNQAGHKKRKGAQQQGKGSGKQMRISNLFPTAKQ